ncbi:MAG: hypothetical protein AAGJ87_16500, partial [Pseudomonadota bacterium]
MKSTAVLIAAIACSVSVLSGCTTPQLGPSASPAIAGDLLTGCVQGAVQPQNPARPCVEYFRLYQEERLFRIADLLRDNDPRLRFIPV